jgi:ribA/ribD-fused uncharacterized protein
MAIMHVILKSGVLGLSCETEAERQTFADWFETAKGHVFYLNKGSAKGGALMDLGLKADACREPINVLFEQGDRRWGPISNLAFTPFTMRGREYASVEGFWQGLKFTAEADRLRVAQMWGLPAKQAAAREAAHGRFVYEDQMYVTGGPEHRSLMLEACRSKFIQNVSAREALLATGERPLTHRVRGESRSIPGALMADIWMRLRAKLRDAADINGQSASEMIADGRIMYFARDREQFGFLSHFYPAPVEIDGEQWPTVEHFYQAQKSFDLAYRAAIRAAETPAAAKRLAARSDPKRPGARRSWFAEFDQQPRPDWHDVKLDIMRCADLAKFTQNSELRDRLLATGTAELIEDSPFDSYWGIGRDGTGLNWAGRVLMEIRHRFNDRKDNVPQFA